MNGLRELVHVPPLSSNVAEVSMRLGLRPVKTRPEYGTDVRLHITSNDNSPSHSYFSAFPALYRVSKLDMRRWISGQREKNIFNALPKLLHVIR